MEWIDLAKSDEDIIPNIGAAVSSGLQESPILEVSVLDLASSTIALYFVHCAFALSVINHCFKMHKINLHNC